ncbi:MAG: GTPase HflX, partial [Bacteroidales bacterium]
LQELESMGRNTIMVFNKIDAYEFVEKDADDLLPATKRNYSLDELNRTWMSVNPDHKTIFISAKHKTNIEEFRSLLYDEVRKEHVKRYPYNDFLYEI